MISILNNIKPHTIFSAKEIYLNHFQKDNYAAFCKKLSRLEKSGEITRLTKGLYYKSKISSFGLGTIPISDKDIINYFIGKNHEFGIVGGYLLYKKYDLTNQIPKKYVIYTTNTDTTVKNINNIIIKKLPINLSIEEKYAFEFLLIVDQFQQIECLDYSSLLKYFEFILKHIIDENIVRVISSISFKKKTIAQAKAILDYFTQKNSLKNYLSPVSSYNIIKMEELYELAQE